MDLIDLERSTANLDAAAASIKSDGQILAGHALELARGSPDIAIALLGVATGVILDGIDEERRADVLRNYLESFE